MVGLNPAKFYGRLLPRPRIYCDVKFSDARVDPPESVNAALLEWASEASWKMGGTAAKRKRMSGKIEGRMNKLRNMEESDDDEAPPPKKPREKQSISFGKKKQSPASVSPKHRTPIEKMLECPRASKAVKQGKLAPRRIMSSANDTDTEKQSPVKPRTRRRRQEQPIESSDEDSDDDLEGFLQQQQAENDAPTRIIRKSTRLQASPSPSETPDSKRKKTTRNLPDSGNGRKSLPRSPMAPNRKQGVEDSESGYDSESIFL